MRLGRIPELGDERVTAQQALHSRALHALAAPVNQPHQRPSGCVSGMQIFVDDRDDIARQKRVEVDRLFNGKANGFFRWTVVVVRHRPPAR
jgi:hypothetical protein